MFKTTKQQKKKGFTLVELVVVIAIIAILAAVLIPQLSGYIKETRKVAVTKEAREIITAAESASYRTNLPYDKTIPLSELFLKDQFTTYCDPAKIDTIDPSDSFKLEDMYKLLDTEHYTFDIDSDNKLSTIDPIS